MSLLLTGGNHVSLLESGVQFFPALIAAIDRWAAARPQKRGGGGAGPPRRFTGAGS